MRKLLLPLVPLCVMMCVAGCGYRVGAVNPDDPIKKIYIPSVKNYTTEPGIEARATSKIVSAFQIDGTYLIVDENDADAILEIELTSFNRSALRYDKQDVTSEYRLTIGSELMLRDAKTRRLLWHASRVEGEEAFFVTVNLPSAQRLAIPLALDDLATKIVERVTERW